MINILINQKFKKQFEEKSLTQFCEITLNHFTLGNVDLSVVIETDYFIKNLNQQYRGIDQSTDVLSFDIDYIDPETNRRYLGDIIISGETVEKDAITNNVTILEETRLLIVHGILHLLGYDHSSTEEETKMWALQNEIIEEIKNFEID